MKEESSPKKTARLAGLLYLAMGITAAYALMYVPSQIIVRGDSAATFENVLANEFLFRTGIASHLVSEVIFIFLVSVLDRLFGRIDDRQAKMMIALVVVQIPIVFVLETFNLTALMIAKGEAFKTLDPVKAQEWTTVFLRLRGNGIIPLEIFYGLWLVPFGRLAYKSGFIPRILGILLIVGGIAYVADSLTFMLFPGYRAFVLPFALAAFAAAEISMILWLLIKGAGERPTIAEN